MGVLSGAAGHAHFDNNWLYEHKYTVLAATCATATAVAGYLVYTKKKPVKKIEMQKTENQELMPLQTANIKAIDFSMPSDVITLDDIAALRAQFQQSMNA